MDTIDTSLIALVRDAGGVTKGQGVVVGADPSALEALGETWRAAQGGQPGYYDYSVECVSLYNGAVHGDYFALVAAMREGAVTLREAANRLEMLAFADGRLQTHDLAGNIVEALALDTPTGRAAGVYDRALEIVSDVLHRAGHPAGGGDSASQGPVDVQALALSAVDAMGDVFWDADEYPNEVLDCPACKEEVRVNSESCPHCGAAFDEPLSKAAAIRQDAVACVVRAIQDALQQAARVQLVRHGPDADDLLHLYRDDFAVSAGPATVAHVRVRPRRYPQASRRTLSKRAVDIRLVGPDGLTESWCVSLRVAESYLKCLGLDPAPLLERAREKGWEV
jgi:hypothetical protein